MKLKVNCKNCRNEFSLKENEVSRMELENELGTLFYYQCNNCMSTDEYHVNDVRAKMSDLNIATIIIGSLFMLFVIVLFFFIGFISSLLIVIPIIIYHQLDKKVNTFNANYVSRTTPYIPKKKKI